MGSLQIAQAVTLREQGIHNENKVTCKDCHLVEKPDTGKPQSKVCLDCHGPYEKIVDRTKKLQVSPHSSHMGPLPCLKCHSVHDMPDEFEGPCAECHADFEFKVK
jgi:formate-dependent nitrite reductase cytochrome c552 subunit